VNGLIRCSNTIFNKNLAFTPDMENFDNCWGLTVTIVLVGKLAVNFIIVLIKHFLERVCA